ncbi:hypothetical protein EVAR_87519_1 [Eumeta japonica]|uniref:Uncharacterized protein n=1 Tax=Eumeta variegata TaxID=151549 RepID=A0A4C1XR66_EUMVA|nr:hypothetical protein EVAR_87519_1 [Eumeta japonica]
MQSAALSVPSTRKFFKPAEVCPRTDEIHIADRTNLQHLQTAKHISPNVVVKRTCLQDMSLPETPVKPRKQLKSFVVRLNLVGAESSRYAREMPKQLPAIRLFIPSPLPIIIHHLLTHPSP